jgi:hypothetical protein
MKPKKTLYSLTDQTRTSLVHLVADAIGELHRGKSTSAPPVAVFHEEESERGDFLYDFTRLNLQYLNQLASLGSSYSAVGARLLEGIHERWLGRRLDEVAAELTIAGELPTHCAVQIPNPLNTKAKISLGRPQCKAAGMSSAKMPRLSAVAPTQVVAAGQSVTLTIKAAGNAALAGTRHEFELPVTFSAGAQSIRQNLKLKVRCLRS